MKPLNFALAWLLFAASYVIFYALIFDCLSKEWLLNTITQHYPQIIENYVWNHVLVLTTFLLAFIINIGFIFLAFAVIKILRQIKYSSAA